MAKKEEKTIIEKIFDYTLEDKNGVVYNAYTIPFLPVVLTNYKVIYKVLMNKILI